MSLLIDGTWIETEEQIKVYNKFNGEEIGQVSVASREQIRQAVASSQRAMKEQPLSSEERYRILSRTSELIMKNQDELALTIATEAGKPVNEAKIEVGRAARTFQISAEEAKRIAGEMVPLSSADPVAKLAFTLRKPIGVVCAISPFNFPINLVAHKVAPAVAAGNAFVLKPATTTPLIAIRLLKLMQEAGLPEGYGHLVIGSGSTVGEWLLEEQGFSFYSFTGSPRVGKHLKEAIGLRPCALELGSNSATVVHHDADIEYAAERCGRTAFNNAGQVCISVQRIMVHEDVKVRFLTKLVEVTKSLRVGDPSDPATEVGPMISTADAERTMDWIQEAVDHGAKLLCGGTRDGVMIQPAVLADVPTHLKLCVEEAFAPIVVVNTYRTLDEAIAMVNNSKYGLQGGLFTKSLEVMIRCANEIHVGGLMVNQTSAFRSDEMPYGGVKESGIGKEGPRYAIQEMTEVKLIVIHQ
ncbi:aldehyde dehydrogenase family protein [Paenibacillus thalictri]|uniref:Aldehyde dehydrogenase family protein n=1 Tax=Paenibacillus thalictri TaxID=2527873 RepID=A0A4Q9DTP3_9BACL|nr:aldehyde dehydrogenase family protein [Paenibacillus thalictri]TBL79070.1 aldehyde dehydrogenase family protein [Paenibacillus thalictri]